MRKFLFVLLCILPSVAMAATCEPGYYLEDNECKKCYGRYYCPGDDSKQECPDPNLYFIPDSSDNFVTDSTDFVNIISLSSPVSTDKQHISDCFAVVWLNSGRGEWYENIYYVPKANTYMAVVRYWAAVGSGYYLTVPYSNVCTANYLYYNQNYACPENHWCPGLQKTLCSAQKPITYTQTLGLNECPETHPYAPEKSTAQSDCYNQCSDIAIDHGIMVVVTDTVNWPNECEYQTICDDGYGLTSDNTCEQLCTAGITKICTNFGCTNLYANRPGTPALCVKNNDTVCYGRLVPGQKPTEHTLHVQHGDTIYHCEN